MGCGSPPPSVPPDVTTEKWYKDAVANLAAIAHTADESFANGKPDDASALIVKGEPIESQILAVPRPR